MKWPMVRTRLLITLGAVAAGAAPAVSFGGCSAQADRHYPGEPLAQIRGSVVTESATGPSAVQASILWIHQSSSDPYAQPDLIGTKVPVTGTFPASFTLSLYDPPPAAAEWHEGAEVLNGLVNSPTMLTPVWIDGGPPGTPVGVWAGYIAAISADNSSTEVHPSDVLGIDTEHIVVYFDHDPKDGGGDPVGWIADNFAVPFSKGYHLAKVDTEQQAITERVTACMEGSVCQHYIETAGTDEWTQANDDWHFARCKRLHPSNPTCTIAPDANGAYTSAADAACMNAFMVDVPACVGLDAGGPPSGPQYQPGMFVGFSGNPNDLTDPATITLGTTVWDGFFTFWGTPGPFNGGYITP